MSGTAEIFTVTCKICGEPLELSIPDGLDNVTAGLLRKWTATAHNRCYDEKQKKDKARAIERQFAERAARWSTVCPPVYHGTIASRIPDQFALRVVMAWAFGPMGLLATGRSGQGKTRSVFLTLRREFQAGRAVAFYTHAQFNRAALDMIGNDIASVRWVRLLATVDILFLDDLGKANFTDASGRGRHAEELLFDIFERRIGSGLPTVFTCSLDGETLTKAMSAERGEPFVRRLREFCQPVAFNAVKRAKETV